MIRMVFTGQDARAVAALLVTALVLLVLGIGFRRRIASLLTPAEWRAFFKIQGILAFTFLLLLMDISLQYPAEMFIYGRF